MDPTWKNKCLTLVVVLAIGFGWTPAPTETALAQPAVPANLLPEGSHDGFEGNLNQTNCHAAGWAADPDDRDADLTVRVLVDGAELLQTTAGNFRQDLLEAGVCVGGTCSFDVDLFSLVSLGVDHVITVQARDAQTGEWVDLGATPKTINCTEANLPPEGFHDAFESFQLNSRSCRALGWAADPNDRDADLSVRILVDGAEVAQATASEFRQDLLEAGVCVGGSCAFDVNLWGLLTPSADHAVLVQARDTQSGDWVNLSNSPKNIHCVNHDIYTFDPKTEKVRQITDTFDVSEFQPTWSNNGHQVAYVVIGSETIDLHVTNLQTGQSKPLEGGDGGIGPAWSPNGLYIAFERTGAGDVSIYIVAAGGGERRLIRSDAVQPSWSPDSRRLVFRQASDGSLRTVALDGGGETVIAPSGSEPAWSPDGHWISYDVDGDGLWKVRVNLFGEPLSAPVQVTDEPGQESTPSWSNDSMTLLFHSLRDFDFDIWMIPATGGVATKIIANPITGEISPAVSNNGQSVAYSGANPIPRSSAPASASAPR